MNRRAGRLAVGAGAAGVALHIVVAFPLSHRRACSVGTFLLASSAPDSAEVLLSNVPQTSAWRKLYRLIEMDWPQRKEKTNKRRRRRRRRKKERKKMEQNKWDASQEKLLPGGSDSSVTARTPAPAGHQLHFD
ncbi:hypothetical protein INR49_031652 [Caranx melampygus]|nr:hypothetical protein INR49_031652 [Caranx melampygus]